MSDKGSVFQKGGGGTNFEQAIQTAFLTTLIIRGNAPLNFANEIIEVAFQTTNRGYETDDLLVVAKSAIGQHRLLVQIKNNITFTADNALFKEVIEAFWKDYNNTALFDKAKDRLIIVKSGFTKEERNHLKSLLDWANTHATETDFVTEANRIKGKKKRLDVFRESLKKVNNNTTLTDKEIWEFLKCFDILEYDFTNQNSIDEIYFFNLIKLCKNSETTVNEKEIWASLSSFVSKLNKDGGSVTTASIQEEELYKYFNPKKLIPYFKSIEKLRSDSEVVLLPLKSTIDGFHLERKKISQTITESVNSFQFTIVTGKPGVGKSAEIKDVLKSEYPYASIFVFRADQFSEPHIANVFSSQGVNETLQDIFSCISLIPEKIIFIDSLEKLLEADPECAFKQLLALLKQFPDINVIGSSRKYAVDLITQKFGIDKKELGRAEVLPLDETELNIVAEKFPQLKGVLKNEKIKKLLQSPKYLDFAISALSKSDDDYTNISLTEFKEKLWNSLVKDSTNRIKGFPAKREDAFMEIAINRAKEMKLFTRAETGDKEAIDLLENDEIIFQENNNRRYSPTHDILEDWALVKYVSSKYEEFPNPKEFFDNLGNEPAIRRAFRLWIEDYLIDDSNKINELIRATISDNSIEGYWADEILIAVFKSDNCASFFSAFEKELLDEKTYFSFLNRCIHLIKTACKESSLNRNNFSILLPIGSGWTEMMYFLKEHITKINLLIRSICNFISDWNYRLMFQRSQTDEQEMLAVKYIVIYYLKQIESGDQFWEQGIVRDKPQELVSQLFELAPICQSEINDLIERAFKNKKYSDSWRLSSYYTKVIDSCISGLGNHILIQELPELVVKTAWREWIFRKVDENSEHKSLTSMINGGRLDRDECWGLESQYNFSPSGIYKTPLYTLLCYHPLIGLKFVTEIINYSIDFYVKAECNKKYQFIEIEIELNDGTKVKQWAAWELWAAYRGVSVTHSAIESLLMSLEKYLLEIAAAKTVFSKRNLKFMFNYLLLHSNNVSIAGVLTSIAIAYPEEVEEAMLPLLSIEEFYEWDLSRALQESSSLATIDNKIPFAQMERWESNQLPYRKKYLRGLIDFIIDYQLNIRMMNTKIHELFDRMQSRINNEDIIWKKLLTEIDLRKWEIHEKNEKLGSYLFQPKYDNDVINFIDSNKNHFEAQNISINFSSIIRKAYESSEQISYVIWNECFIYYSKKPVSDFLDDRHLTTAIIGLRDLNNELNITQTLWCLKTIRESIESILQDVYNTSLNFNRNYNFMEKEIGLSSYHYLFANTKNQKELNDLIFLMTYTISAPFNDFEANRFLEYVRTVFFEKYPEEAKRVWYCLIKFSEFKKNNQESHDYYDHEKHEEYKLKEQEYIKEQSENLDLTINILTLDLKKYEGYLLKRAFVIIPYTTNDKIFTNYIQQFIQLITHEITIEEDHYYNQHRNEEKLQFQEIHDAQLYIRDLLLYADIQFSKTVLDLILNPLYESDFKLWKGRNDLYNFASNILEYIIRRLDKVIAESINEVFNKKLIDNFWNIWEYLFERIKDSGKLYLTPQLFFDIEWKEDSMHWKAFENKKDFYSQMVKDLGTTRTQSMLNLFSTAGEQTFLPYGISWLVEIFKVDINTTSSLTSPAAERMIKRLFYNHVSKIKSNKKLIDDYLWILNKMVDLGSSEAYLFRENVITYKSKS
ncbi:MAG: hypothetical protein IM638_13385 [Bacteroidetes bacterium]|nr:hypothetical protein [Bacteroidota bacterium]